MNYQKVYSESPRTSNISGVSLDSNIEESPERGSSRNSRSSSTSSVSFGSFQGASTPLQEAPTLLQAWENEYKNDYKGEDAKELNDAGKLIMSKIMGVKLDSTQHNAIRKLIKENKFDPRVWRTANDKREFPSDCNKDSTYDHCIFMGVHEKGNIYLDQWGNFFDKDVVNNNLQYVVPGEPNDMGYYEFKIHKPINLVDTTNSEAINKMFDNAEEQQRQKEINSSDSGASKSLLEKWKDEQTKIYNDENSGTLVKSDIMGIKLTKRQHEVIEELIINKNFEPHMWKEHKMVFGFSYVSLHLRSGKVVMGTCFDDHLSLEAVGRNLQTTIYLDKEGNYIDEFGNTGYSIVSDKPEPYHLYIFEKNIQGAVQLSPEQDVKSKYPTTIALGKGILAIQNMHIPSTSGHVPENVAAELVNTNDHTLTDTSDETASRSVSNDSIITTNADEVVIGHPYMESEAYALENEDTLKDFATKAIDDEKNEQHAYDYIFIDKNLKDLLEYESTVIKDIIETFVKANTYQTNLGKKSEEGKKNRRKKIQDLKNILNDIGIKNITQALLKTENDPRWDGPHLEHMADINALKNIEGKLEIFLLEITSYIHTNTCREGSQRYIPLSLAVGKEGRIICEKNKYFIYNQMYKMVRGLRVVFEIVKEKFYSTPNPMRNDAPIIMEKILKILKYYEEYYIKHRESRSSYEKIDGGKTQRKRKTRKFRKMKNKAKSHKKRIRIKSRKLR